MSLAGRALCSSCAAAPSTTHAPRKQTVKPFNGHCQTVKPLKRSNVQRSSTVTTVERSFNATPV
eukprot:1949661-Rhodomonas_salina.1